MLLSAVNKPMPMGSSLEESVERAVMLALGKDAGLDAMSAIATPRSSNKSCPHSTPSSRSTPSSPPPTVKLSMQLVCHPRPPPLSPTPNQPIRSREVPKLHPQAKFPSAPPVAQLNPSGRCSTTQRSPHRGDQSTQTPSFAFATRHVEPRNGVG